MKLGLGVALALLFVGLLCVVAGVALIYAPAGLIIGGCCLVTMVWLGVDVGGDG